MKKMTIADLDIYLKNTSIRNISFKTKNQKWFDDFGIFPVQVLTFPKIEVCVNPNCVMLHDTDSHIHFNNLKYASVEEGSPGGGIVIVLTGEDFYHPEQDVEYYLTAG